MADGNSRNSAIASGVAVLAVLAALVFTAIWVHRSDPVPLPDDSEPARSVAAKDMRVVAAPPLPAPPPAPAPLAPVPLTEPRPAGETRSLEDVIGQVMPAVVLIETSTGRGSG